LDCGQPSFRPGFSCLALLRNKTRDYRGRLGDYHPLWCGVPNRFGYPFTSLRGSPEPRVLSYNPYLATAGALAPDRFRHRPVRSPLLRVWFSLPPATEMFQLAGCPPGPARYSLRSELPHSEIRGSVPVSGSPRHIGAVPRPSSARSARASIVCSFCLPCSLAWSRPEGRLFNQSEHMRLGKVHANSRTCTPES
jgi:hypothetical protein